MSPDFFNFSCNHGLVKITTFWDKKTKNRIKMGFLKPFFPSWVADTRDGSKFDWAPENLWTGLRWSSPAHWPPWNSRLEDKKSIHQGKSFMRKLCRNVLTDSHRWCDRGSSGTVYTAAGWSSRLWRTPVWEAETRPAPNNLSSAETKKLCCKSWVIKHNQCDFHPLFLPAHIQPT